MMERAYFRDFVERHLVEMVDFVPGMLKHLLLPREGRMKSLDTVISGGETLDERLKDDLLDEGYRLCNHYGPTEVTVDALAAECSTGSGVCLGKPVANTVVYILDGFDRLQPPGVPGEICVGGAGLARGYLNNPELTNEKFTPNRFKEPEEKIYRTGDLGLWLEDGNVRFLGRLDQQVKVRGFRVELEEIRNVLCTHPLVKESVVTAHRDKDESTTLYAYYVCGATVEPGGISTFLAGKLPGYMVPSGFMQLDQIPLTVNGKPDLHGLPSPGPVLEAGYHAPRNTVDAALVTLFSEVLGTAEQDISIDADFFRLGGHSLRATMLVSRIHKALDVEVPLSRVFETPSVRGLSAYIAAAAGDRHSGIPPVEKKEFYPLSSAQKRMFILQRVDKKNVNYNMPEAVLLDGRLDIERFKETFRRLIQRHESLRTSFIIIDNQPVQRVHEQVDSRFEEPGAAAEDTAVTGLLQRFIRPFDLSLPPLMRVKLVKRAEDRHYLLVDMFHIIADGVSIGIFIKDFMALYNNEAHPGLSVQYKDFAQWQNRLKDSPSLKRQESYWLEEFAEEIPKLNLPLDFPRPARQRFEGGMLRFQLEPEPSAALKNLAAEEGVSLFMVLLSLFNILLWKISASSQITVGTPIAGRKHHDLEGIMGMFVNTLALKNIIQEDESFTHFLDRVKSKTLRAYENQDYQFEDLVEHVVEHRDPARHPIFDVVFALQNMDISEIAIPGLTLTFSDYSQDIALFDLYLVAEEHAERLPFKIAYCTRLFKKETIESFADYFLEIIAAVIDDKEIPLQEVTISQRLLEPGTEMIDEAMGDFGF
jgi:acyl carrier protein